MKTCVQQGFESIKVTVCLCNYDVHVLKRELKLFPKLSSLIHCIKIIHYKCKKEMIKIYEYLHVFISFVVSQIHA